LPTYSKFLDVHEIPLTPREFSIVMDVIPTGVFELLSANTQNSITPPFAFYLIDTAIGNLCFFLWSCLYNYLFFTSKRHCHHAKLYCVLE